MLNLYDILYGAAIGLSGPYWILAPRLRRKLLRAFRQRTGNVPRRDPGRPAIMIHAVSLGEINATRELATSIRVRVAGFHVGSLLSPFLSSDLPRSLNLPPKAQRTTSEMAGVM
jgi:3-deoxy-D-manno-octulosonic-acid transferase